MTTRSHYRTIRHRVKTEMRKGFQELVKVLEVDEDYVSFPADMYFRLLMQLLSLAFPTKKACEYIYLTNLFHTKQANRFTLTWLRRFSCW